MNTLDANIGKWVRGADFPALPSGRLDVLPPITGPIVIRFSPRPDDTSPDAVGSIQYVASGSENNVDRLRKAGLHLMHKPFKFPYEPQLEGDALNALLGERDYEHQFPGILTAGMYIAGEKAKLAFDRLREPVIVTDVGLAWRHMPHLYTSTKSLMEPDPSGLGRNFKAQLCAMAHSCGDTRVVAVAAAAVFNGRHVRSWAIGVSGVFAPQPTGDGWAFDDIFCPNIETQASRAPIGQKTLLTWSQISEDERFRHHPFRELLVDRIRAEIIQPER